MAKEIDETLGGRALVKPTGYGVVQLFERQVRRWKGSSLLASFVLGSILENLEPQHVDRDQKQNSSGGSNVQRAKNKKPEDRGRRGNFYILTARICKSFIWPASEVKPSPQRDTTCRLRRRIWHAIRDLDGNLLLCRGEKLMNIKCQ